jgi:hypothetical protein
MLGSRRGSADPETAEFLRTPFPLRALELSKNSWLSWHSSFLIERSRAFIRSEVEIRQGLMAASGATTAVLNATAI